jgi:hypothetical protein
MSDRLSDSAAECSKICMVQRNTFWELDYESESDDIQLGQSRRARYDSDVEYCDFCDQEESTGDTDECDETNSICSLTTLEDWGSSRSEDDGTVADSESRMNNTQCGSMCWWQGVPVWNYNVPMATAAPPFAQPMSFVPSWNQADALNALVPRRRYAGSSRQEARKWQAPKSKRHSPSTASTSASDDDDQKQRPSGRDAVAKQGFTTIILRNLPKSCTREVLTKTMDANGFARCYDFVHVPVSFLDLVGLGYALVNMVDHEAADRAHKFFSGFRGWLVPTTETEACEVGWSSSNQGLAAHIERYRNSPLMHESVPRQYRPALFRNGVLGTFPGPTVRLRPPRVRHQKPIEAPIEAH